MDDTHHTVETLTRLDGAHRRGLAKLGIHTVRDLLYHFPVRYESVTDIKSVATLVPGEEVVLYGTLSSLKTRKTWKTKKPMTEGTFADGTGRVKVMWFHQPYLANMLEDGAQVKITGRVEGSPEKPYLANPEIERGAGNALSGKDSLFGVEERNETGELFALYPETRGITSRWFRFAVARALRQGLHKTVADPIPEDVRMRYHLPDLETALVWIHAPRKEADARAARKRFAFEEVLVIQTTKRLARLAHDKAPALAIPTSEEDVATFTGRFPFTLTKGQKEAVEAIMRDIAAPPAMARLLEGDVGSGKTAVAATTAFAVVKTRPPGRVAGNLQVAYMAPTEILAAQHFQSFTELFRHLPIPLGLITSSGCKKFPSKVHASGATTISRTQLLKWVANGEIPILIGTHSLIQKSVRFQNLAYVIIDEQHRFGTMQRGALMRKDGLTPHLLSMTATPIPRTLALTLYGDLDLTVLAEMPKGRKSVITEIITKEKRVQMYEKLKRELEAGRQAYIICPRIDEPDPRKANAVQTKSAKTEAARLSTSELKGYRIGLLHGAMKSGEKDEVMRRFLHHDLDVLVATSVVEVGVNVPNATVIVIEGAERFGLAQLHQLRGRVVRSEQQAYCFLLTTQGKEHARLKALATAKNGFALAEMDLKLRGPGELYGRQQSGLSDLGMEALKNLKMVEAARSEAKRITEEDPTLVHYPTLREYVTQKHAKLHFE